MIVVGLCVLICLPSCTLNFRIEKRQHRDGFYVSSKKHKQTTASDSLYGENALDVATVYTEMQEDSTALRDSLPTVTKARVIRRDSAISTVPQDEIHPETNPRQIYPHASETEVVSADVPEEARRINTLSLVAMGMLILGVIASIVAFMPFVSAGFGVLIAAAPFLVLGALGLGIWLLVKARRRKQTATTPETQSYYDKLRKRARLIVILSSAVIVVFVLFLALIIAALSTFN